MGVVDGVREVHLYCPYLIVNRTHCPLVVRDDALAVKVRGALDHNSDAATGATISPSLAEPVLFSYELGGTKKRARIRISYTDGVWLGARQARPGPC
jgi:hypothetical protein